MLDNIKFGRLEPPRYDHVYNYPYVVEAAVETVNKLLPLPDLVRFYNQMNTNGCVGYSCSWMMSILNEKRYDAIWLWNMAKELDRLPETYPGDNNGTTLEGAMRGLHKYGHVPYYKGRRGEWKKKSHPSPSEGILSYRWATTVDQVRTSISEGIPVELGISWHEDFTTPVVRDGLFWIGVTQNWQWSRLLGGHGICLYGAYDAMEAFYLINTWGPDKFPFLCIPYDSLQYLLNSGGEAVLVVDRP